jgi:Mg2+-importing ATPase
MRGAGARVARAQPVRRSQRVEHSFQSGAGEFAPARRPSPARARWFSLLFGVALVLAVVALLARPDERAQFAALLHRAQPTWILLGIALQLATYAADARILQVTLQSAGIAGPLGTYMGLGFAKLFVDHTIPTGGVTGTLLLVRALDRRGVGREASMAALVVNLVSHYAAHALAVAIALAYIAALGDMSRVVVGLTAAFAVLALVIPGVLWRITDGRHPVPGFAQRSRLLRPWLRALAQADPRIAHDRLLTLRCTLLQLSVIALDAATLWSMLRALGLSVSPLAVFASFMLSTLARILGVVPGGLGVFEATSVASLRLMGVPVAAGVAATLLFRGFSFWLPLLPGTLFARRETRAA